MSGWEAFSLRVAGPNDDLVAVIKRFADGTGVAGRQPCSVRRFLRPEEGARSLGRARTRGSGAGESDQGSDGSKCYAQSGVRYCYGL